MRKNIISIVGIIFCAGVLFITSCTKMDHFYKDYVIERTYIGKPDSIWIQPGNLSVQIGMLTPKDPAAKDLIVRWNETDSVVLAIDHKEETNSIIIKNLEERDYVFNAYTVDGLGNHSLTMELLSTVYGDKFKRIMQDWNFSHSVVFTDSIAVMWARATLLPETLLGNDIEFTDADGVDQKVFAPRTEWATVLHKADPSKPITVKSVYNPDVTAFEYFYTEPIELDVVNTKRTSLTFSSNSYTDAAYVDFNFVRTFLEDEVLPPTGADIDMTYALGAGSRGNLFAMDGTGFSAFAANWQALISSWTVRNASKMKLNRSATAIQLYDDLDETNRSQMIAAFDNSSASQSSRLSSLATNDVVLLHSSDRGIYVAMKVISTPPPVSGAPGDFIIEFKISRP